GTPLEDLRKPRVRAILLGLRGFALHATGIAARVLAREVCAPRMTIWRQLHLVRLLLPRPAALASLIASATQVCGRRMRRHKHKDKRVPCLMYRPTPGFVVAGAHNAVRMTYTKPDHQGRMQRMVAESMHSWLVGTHHGVTACWLERYCLEFAARSY